MKNILYLAIFTTIVVILWIGFSIYHSINSSTIAPVTNTQIEQIPSTFDLATVKQVKQRKTVPVNLKEKVLIPVTSPRIVSTESSNSAPLIPDITQSTPSPDLLPEEL